MVKRMDESLQTAEVKDKAFCEKTTKLLNYLNGNQTLNRNKYKYVFYTIFRNKHGGNE